MLVNTFSTTIVIAVDAQGSPPPQTGSLLFCGAESTSLLRYGSESGQNARRFEPVPQSRVHAKRQNGRKVRRRVADHSARHPRRINDNDELLPPGSAGHKGRDSPKRSANERQLESHGAVLSDVDSSWAQD